MLFEVPLESATGSLPCAKSLSPVKNDMDTQDIRDGEGTQGRYACDMKRRQPPDTYTDTMLWIADGRRSWNRKPRKLSASSKLGRPLAARKHGSQSPAGKGETGRVRSPDLAYFRIGNPYVRPYGQNLAKLADEAFGSNRLILLTLYLVGGTGIEPVTPAV